MSKKIETTNLVENYKELKKKLNDLETKKYDFKIKSICGPFGAVSSMTEKVCVQVHAQMTMEIQCIDKSITELGLTGKVDEARKFNGHTYEEWSHDIKLRLEQLKDEKEICKLRKATNKLYNEVMTAEDKAAFALEEVNDILD
jgi:hypothetical protein